MLDEMKIIYRIHCHLDDVVMIIKVEQYLLCNRIGIAFFHKLLYVKFKHQNEVHDHR